MEERITGPDMESLTPSKKEQMIEILKENYPVIYKILAKAVGGYKEHFSLEPFPKRKPQDRSQRLLD